MTCSHTHTHDTHHLPQAIYAHWWEQKNIIWKKTSSFFFFIDMLVYVISIFFNRDELPSSRWSASFLPSFIFFKLNEIIFICKINNCHELRGLRLFQDGNTF
jgi:hypothetical protein